jgi:hypothetical protein
MTLRFPRLVFLASLVLASSTYVVSGFSRTMTVVVSGFLTTDASAEVVSRTMTAHAPGMHDDGIWQSARQITTTSGTRFRIGKHDLRTATTARPRTLTAVYSELTGELGNLTRDRSPQHSIPLLI